MTVGPAARPTRTPSRWPGPVTKTVVGHAVAVVREHGASLRNDHLVLFFTILSAPNFSWISERQGGSFAASVNVCGRVGSLS